MSNTSGFPLKKKFLQKPEEIFSLAQKEYLGQITVVSGSVSERFLPEGVKPEFRDTKNVVLLLNEDHQKIDDLTDLFTEEMRIKSNVKGNPSPWKYFQENQGKLLEEAKELHQPISDYLSFEEVYRETIYRHVRGPDKFFITATVLLLRYFKSKWVLDPSAGWGDRLLGAALSGVEVDHGVDPNSSLTPTYQEILKFLENQSLASDSTRKWSVTTASFTDPQLGFNMKYDTVLVSPPPYDKEIYSSDAEQSIQGQKTYADWLKNFYQPYLRKAYDSLLPKGWFILYITETYLNDVNQPLAKDTLDHMKKIGARYEGTIMLNNSVPIFVWSHI